jgi:hypothetical protein
MGFYGGGFYNSIGGGALDSKWVDELNELKLQVQSMSSYAPKEVYATVAELQTAFPTGTTGVYLVSADGHWYYWNGSSWADGGLYQSNQAIDDKIKTFTFKATIDATTHIVHNLAYNPTTDYLSVFYKGVLLEATTNYTYNVDNVSIDLVGWSINSNEIIEFKLYNDVK